MEYFKKYAAFIILSLIVFGCSADEEPQKPLELTITNFKTSYNEVKIDWELQRPDGVIIDDLTIYRIEKNGESDFYQEKMIANLPSNETSFVDTDVPYKEEVSYSVRILYRDEREKVPTYGNEMKSETKKFIRDIIKFDRVPFQVQKDPTQPNIFHILNKDQAGSLIKYNSTKNSIEHTTTFENGFYLNNKFHIVNNNEIYIADTKGRIYRINTNSYETIDSYLALVTDNLNSFSVSGNRIYYQDDEDWCIYDTSARTSTKTGYISNSDYSEYMGNDKTLLLYCQNEQYGSMGFVGYTPANCPGFMDCSPVTYYYTPWALKPNSIDANIFSWNTDKSKCISSINGCVFNTSTLKPEIRLNDITGKHYFQFAFDAQNNIYATVQGEKKIHKFNSEYKLVEVIDTKLYPLFPLLTTDGLKVVGSYEPVSYWSFGYGNNFDFNVKCAIETF
ncbi:hypothetical protein BD847_0088 [Flavobacterium cutihirudinis]|uniref:Fibronectin type-III domain-containing protein n=1 Tax=Flavobacterium cutihirudinis TaxID=1265740 RepID=A0A3D9FYX0_9FLAO|nr:hypothetical protein [Flavobacterium cutihirudinis]RED26176.1 hypothetical protein BD847_0088 [Flavobacterium cutihirudinis]